jgi:hypothetical protein
MHNQVTGSYLASRVCLRSNDNVIDGYVDEFNEESNETHDAESNSRGDSNLLELSTVGLRASFD